MDEDGVKEEPVLFSRICFHDLKDDDEEEIFGGDVPNSVSRIGEKIFQEENGSDSISSRAGSDVSSVTTSSKQIVGLRRSHSDAGDGSLSLDEKAQAADQKEKSKTGDKHRLSFASTQKRTSPILRRRHRVDNAIHNLLQEGKDFLHRKRHHVALLGAHFNKSDTPSSSASMASTTNSDLANFTTFQSTSIAYSRKDDSVTLDNDSNVLDEKETSVLQLLPSGLLDQPSDIAKESSPSGSQNQNQAAPKSVPRPNALSAATFERGVQMDRVLDGQASPPNRPNWNTPIFDSSKSTTSPFWWKYYKEIIFAILMLITMIDLGYGYRALPLFLFGMLWGIYLSYLAALVVFWFCLPPERYPSFGAAAESLPGNEREATAQVGEEELLLEETIIYKGWMNRLPNKYDPHKYHINNTHSVLVRLDRSVLRLSTPKTNLPRHAFCRDPRLNPTFISQELFDMTGAVVSLRPKNLAHRRWWSRKYPICVTFPIKRGQNRRSSSPGSVTTQDSGTKEKTAIDAASTATAESIKEEKPTEVAVDALEESGIATSDGENADDESDEGKSGTSLQSRLSLPSFFNAAGQETPLRKPSAKKGTKRQTVYLFARSQREKEQWFYKLRQAACHYTYSDRRERFFRQRLRGAVGSRFYSTSDAQTSSEPGTPASVDDEGYTKADDPLATEWILYISMQKQYERHMRSFMTKPPAKVEVQGMDLICMAWKTWMVTVPDAPATGVTADSKSETPSTPGPSLNIDWANALGSRVFCDFSKNPHWMGKVQDRVQRKLATIHLPYFIETLKLTHLESGMTAPKVTVINEPSMNEWGLWIDAKLEYSGGLRLVLETKVNLMKLKTEAGPGRAVATTVGEKCSNYENEEMPESPESSPDEDASSSYTPQNSTPKAQAAQETTPLSTGKKILNFVDKLAQSKVFQEATDNKYLKKWMQGVSDTPFILEVEVIYLSGALAVNIPPPPSDRLWWGFRFPPKVVLKARPRVGERVVNLSRITDWIENKMLSLLEKNLVIPNMDDLIIPMLGGSPLCNQYNK